MTASFDGIERFVHHARVLAAGIVMHSRVCALLRSTRLHAAAWVPAVFAALVVLAACGNGDDATPETTTSTTAPESESADDEARLEEVVEALYASHDAVCEALGPPAPDPDHPDLSATSTGPVLGASQELAREFAEEGLAFDCPEESYEIEVLSYEFGTFEGDEVAWVEVCAIDAGERIVVETGEVVGGGLAAAHTSDVLLRVEGRWKLEGRRVNEQWEGEERCDVA